ncbi:hypothetical protein ABB37_05339 [Leptomonas pyrrhocoris]|uniref:Uncharacterized protein n=1 Tax=Leptomonas pyrrhocoris TaxID=157538 RepID=A0A0M9FZX0_LEPPY|nr:hypothetical protein ABB37_05339 [Leptomonas pyrrhocoris]KPA79515.1 hypothetical protein ABB37_05339 [Leptomonas pyrrhocoris]|eukprot:XP_015657954.1 hypothetical protein ABB37_05339 [Leptomonas pyrrhocoris]
MFFSCSAVQCIVDFFLDCRCYSAEYFALLSLLWCVRVCLVYYYYYCCCLIAGCSRFAILIFFFFVFSPPWFCFPVGVLGSWQERERGSNEDGRSDVGIAVLALRSTA